MSTPPKDGSFSPLHIKSAIHEKVYHWAKEHVRGKQVLDVGCGSGRGSALLAETAAKVSGIDIDRSVIEQAAEKWRRNNLDFDVMDGVALDFPSGSIDVVVANALLEYLPDPMAFFDEARRVLRDDGRMICGTKNLARSLKTRDGNPLYRNHLQEFTAESLKGSMSKHFRDMEIYSETMNPRAEALIMDSRALGIEQFLVALNIKHFFPAALRRRIRRLVTGVDVKEIGPADFEISRQAADDALYVICIGTAKQ